MSYVEYQWLFGCIGVGIFLLLGLIAYIVNGKEQRHTDDDFEAFIEWRETQRRRRR